MASPGLELAAEGQPQPEPAFGEAQKWIEQVTGRSFGEKDFRSGLENGILLCELLNAIKPGLIKKINRLPTPIAGLDNIILFLRGCKELGLKESQLFDPGDLQDTSNRVTVKNIDCSRKLKNVLVTIYWLGKAANSCTSYSGSTLNLKEFEGLLAQMRKETEDIESPKRSIRDSGYIDCWDSERSDSLSPPRHGRDDSFDSLDSFGSRSQQTPSPDVVLRGSSDGRGSDSETDLPHRKMPDVKKDDMLARRTSHGEPKSAVPFNQYLPNKSNQTFYVPAPLRKKKAEREEYRKSWSTATSPLGDRPFSKPETIEEEQNETSELCEKEKMGSVAPEESPIKHQVGFSQREGNSIEQSLSCSAKETSAPEGEDAEEIRKLRRLEQAGIKVMSAAQRYGSKMQAYEDNGSTPDIILRKENPFMTRYQRKDSGSEDETANRVPDLEKDDFATRRARMNQPKHIVPFNSFIIGPYTNKDKGKLEDSKKPLQVEKQEHARGSQVHVAAARQLVTHKENTLLKTEKSKSEEEEEVKVPDTERDDLAKRKSQNVLPQPQEDTVFVNASITKADLETWKRLKLSGEPSEEDLKCPSDTLLPAEVTVKAAARDDFAVRKARANKKAGGPKQKFVHFGPVTEIDQQKWDRLSIGRASRRGEAEEASSKDSVEIPSGVESSPSAAGRLRSDAASKPQNEPSEAAQSGTDECHRRTLSPAPATSIGSEKQALGGSNKQQESAEEECDEHLPDIERDDMLVRRLGTFQRRTTSPIHMYCPPLPVTPHLLQQRPGEAVAREKDLKTPREAESTVTQEESQEQLEIPHQQSGGTENKVKFPDPQRDDMLARRTGAFLKQPGPSVKQFLPMPFSKQQTKQGTAREPEKKTVRPEKCAQVCSTSSGKPVMLPQQEQQGQERCDLPPAGQDDTICTAQVGEHSLNEVHPDQTSKLQDVPEENKNETLSAKDEHLQTFGPRTAVSDDAESVSMFDMRCEEEAVSQPHSKARHEKLQNIHNQLKEDETRWQDDLARWKSRRRSASQDLIKKEAERKKMERLLSGDGSNERRKSIKTYREIVEEKERRERELHEAYKNAKSQEEAESILQQYIERFTISEAVLERLQMPKILERSHSVEPDSPLKDPNPLRYLRQQSLPAPKFTATIEATIVPTAELEPSGSTGRTSPSKSVVSKAVPMLTPKPYSQPKNTQEVLKNFKVDGKVSVNGENFNGVEEKDKECTTVIFTQSPSRSLKFDGVARGDRPPVELKKDPTSVELSLQRPATQSVHKEPTASPGEVDPAASQQTEGSPGGAGPGSPLGASPGSDQKQFKSTAACASPVVKSLEFPPSPVPSKDVAPSEKDVKKPEMEQQKEIVLRATQEVIKPKALEQEGSIVLPFLKKLPETSQVTLQNSDRQADSDSGDKSNRFNFWSWDPEEERKRQERWQHEQERLLQEKYQKEQDKLKEEWEKAQREVEEEERRYYEEERKIIEDTVVPFIVSSNSADLLSSSSSTTEGNKTENTTDSNSSPEEGKQNEVTRQKKLLWEQDSIPPLKSKENERWQEKRSGNKVLSGHPETGILKGGEQEHQVSMMERSSPARLNLPLTQDVSWNQQLLTKQSPHCSEDIRQRSFLGQSVGQKPNSTGEGRRAGCHENFRSGPLSPCSPAAPSQSPNRSVSGKKLCSTCGLPLGKGAAMIIETLGLYFHIQCFRCGICKGQLGDAASGTDVRIRNGLLNCNDCYIRSRTAGQPTTL
ncbi:LIM and calponin homology domains-containing protein 1 isoform X10 [Anas platyrhynchos]|uniref:LIM and calponin homology domains-containing protein 1 isoform X10 n=1 Tax=Anas platyrhynchos TaxID=8839 RepID=UPI000F7C5CB2|nr:LIM and calponin homology domains-containing protein 1 isoform X12 [Anas platyrhynchos]|eukprot:XP_027312991.1 LIM and calponin homology domains-containing protein 1 isoform X8 [Anas platyrhynchos]